LALLAEVQIIFSAELGGTNTLVNVDLGGNQEFGNAKSAFLSRPNRETARRYLLAWADYTMGNGASAASAAVLRKLASDEDYCLAYVDAEKARVRRAWDDVAAAGAKLEAARHKASSRS
jgi:hypothetical protein